MALRPRKGALWVLWERSHGPQARSCRFLSLRPVHPSLVSAACSQGFFDLLMFTWAPKPKRCWALEGAVLSSNLLNLLLPFLA